MRADVHDHEIRPVQARDAQLIDDRGDGALPEQLVGAAQVDQVRRVDGDGLYAARAQALAKLGQRLGLFRAPAPGGGVVRPDLDGRRADLRGPVGGLEQSCGQRQMRPDLTRTEWIRAQMCHAGIVGALDDLSIVVAV